MIPISQAETTKCPAEFTMAVSDILDVISGTWQLPIPGLDINGKIGFGALKRHSRNYCPDVGQGIARD
jgi:hypothetical protein